ncbi:MULTISPECIES: threonine/serine dehydratase [unclassified Isoptericola]|uniref:threonine ammonia-lyase n=1 Tax=unclassified Isoptericola TaxID=2623355 RepID=UPI0027140265|nr:MULTISPECIES: pyridoxal-phosphate dependent enzyme [unclassified Isoptericola]MDO8144858.1 pyridoxal-phosphate dependent enzyme [Isoptericola sp. 178]MDO8149638.1 pyridoxal-phosphate dependent enzyme [Isoptericola sp. b515]MDO8152572.1 pyridoxal-phosphate dependent enzyme [Isoptericola sp. b408]
MAPAPPTIDDVRAARQRLEGLVVTTPTTAYPELDRRVRARGSAGTSVVVKHENLQHTGAFKVRGALNLVRRGRGIEHGVVAYSTGNHAQALAYASAAAGVPCTIVMPRDPNPVKERAVRDRGAEVVLHGADLGEAAVHARSIADRRGARLVSAGDEPELVAGVATATVELLEQAPDLDTLVVPVGGGSGAAAACLVTAALAPHVEVVGVQSSAAPAAHDSWRSGALRTRPVRTRAEGLAVGCGFALTQTVLLRHLADFLLVDDEAITEAQHAYLTAARTVAEGAGAAALAAVLSFPDRFAGRRVGVVCSGGNAREEELLRALTCDAAGAAA